MKFPKRELVGSSEEWRELCLGIVPGLDTSLLVIVHTPSATAYVHENFEWASNHRRLLIGNEPSAADFSGLDGITLSNQLVIGIGGGKALDAAKTVACWGTTYTSSIELDHFLRTGGRIDQARQAKLLLAPSLASSGSESSKAAIVFAGNLKTGLRGESLMADVVVHDQRLWRSIPESVALHYAFDIFAHLLETTVSFRRTEQSLAWAAEGFGHLGHWLFRQNASLASYGEAMEAAFSAGVCLATSSTCLPHRVQYVLGPATGTTHVEGIWYLAQGWFPLVALKRPDRMEDAARMLNPRKLGLDDFEAAFDIIHSKSRGLVRQERFAGLARRGAELAQHVCGDLAADPIFDGVSTIENLITLESK